MTEEIEKYKQAWEKFQAKMTSLKKRRNAIMENISAKFDQQQIAAIMKKLQK
ncbi:MAG: hypothetical protein WC823_05560 [Parcubacteria group bacterium]|jgi:hypothetical protein